jgi:hypothetical protein
LGCKPGIGQCILKLEVGGCHDLSLRGGLIAVDGEWCTQGYSADSAALAHPPTVCPRSPAAAASALLLASKIQSARWISIKQKKHKGALSDYLKRMI